MFCHLRKNKLLKRVRSYAFIRSNTRRTRVPADKQQMNENKEHDRKMDAYVKINYYTKNTEKKPCIYQP